MPTVTTNYFRQELSVGNVSLSGDTYHLSLMNEYVSSSSEATLKQVSTWADVSAYEVSATGYSAVELTAPTISATVNNVVYWDGTNITWSGVTLSAAGHTVYRGSDGLVVGFVEYTEIVEAVNGDITIAWNANGIMNIF